MISRFHRGKWHGLSGRTATDKGETTLTSSVWHELARILPSILWILLVGWVIVLLRKPLIETVIPRIGKLKAGPMELSFIERSMNEAADQASRNNVVLQSTVASDSAITVASTVQKKIEVTRADRERVIARAQRCAEVLRNRRILWLDDVVGNNRLERDMLERLGLKIEQAQSNAAAFAALEDAAHGYDVILSDIARPAGEASGLDFLEAYRAKADRLPLIFYVSALDDTKPAPPGAFGLTNRPDELLHLVIDALERRA